MVSENSDESGETNELPPGESGVKIAGYMKEVLIVTILAATFVMSLPFFITFFNPSSTATESIKDVLPFATALAGFAGGLVVAMFARSGNSSSG
jgi:hypothetical protein